MALPTEEQNAVWALTLEQLSLNATLTWQYMADNSEVEWSAETGAADISSGMGGTLSTSEVSDALEELEQKELITSRIFKVQSPGA